MMQATKIFFGAGVTLLAVGSGLLVYSLAFSGDREYMRAFDSLKSEATRQEEIATQLDAQVAAYWTVITAANQRLNRPPLGSPEGYCQNLPLSGSELEVAVDKALCNTLEARAQSEQSLAVFSQQVQEGQARFDSRKQQASSGLWFAGLGVILTVLAWVQGSKDGRYRARSPESQKTYS